MGFEDYCRKRDLLSFSTAALISVRNSNFTTKLKICEIVVIIRILNAIGQIFSLIVYGVADRIKKALRFLFDWRPIGDRHAFGDPDQHACRVQPEFKHICF